MSNQEIDLDVTHGTPDQGPPPRQVQPWTRVHGHVITRGTSVSICGCGSWRSDRGPGSLDEHVRDAWPVLVPRDDGDADIRAWMARVEVALGQAVVHRDELSAQQGLDQPLRDGHAIPVPTPEYVTAGSRVDVLEHQLEELRERVLRSRRRGY